MHKVACNVLVYNFEKPQMVVNAQLKRIYSFQLMKLSDVAALIKYAKIMLSCVNDLAQFNYVAHLTSEKVLDSAARKVKVDMKTQRLTYVNQMNLCQPGFPVSKA